VAHNVDHEEIAKFEAVASRWWDLEGEFKPLHRINPLRLGYIAERSGGLFGKKVLDVGCGGGILAESMAREGRTSRAWIWALNRCRLLVFMRWSLAYRWTTCRKPWKNTRQNMPISTMW
jgi:2-polyprenyl-3-methyl-5-hydroxy-6-metoxy-1,4-benzoquinol methylase